jgi:putative ABC transport system permease protein
LIENPAIMFRNHLTIAFRLLLRHSGFTAISLLGLSIGLAASLLIFLWARGEYRKDRFHANGDRIYNLYRSFPEGDGGIQTNFTTPYLLAAKVEEEVPEVERAIPTDYPQKRILEVGNRQFRERGVYADPSFFQTFSYPIIAGSLESAAGDKRSMLISASLARRLFGENWQEGALGSTIRVETEHDMVVEAVYEDMPAASSFQWDYVMNMDYRAEQQAWILEWGNNVIITYLLLAPAADMEQVEAKLNRVLATTDAFREGEYLMIQPFEESYLYSKIEDGVIAGGRIEYVRLFIGAALFLLLIACINFVSLATARASRRAKEVGIRKVVGAQRTALFRQFMTEAGLLTATSILLALLIVQLILPIAQRVTSSQLAIDYREPEFWLALAGFFAFTTLLSGIYPALVLSSFRPVHTLKGHLAGEWDDAVFRKGLVVLQFGLSFLLIAGAAIVHQQIDFIKNKNMGLDRENVIHIRMDRLVERKADLIKEELTRQPGIASVTKASHAPIEIHAGTSGIEWPGKPAEHTHTDFRLLWTEPSFLETFKVEMAAGRFFREDTPSDTAVIVLNETAARIIGMDNILEQPITFWQHQTRVIGIVKDFHVRSLFEEIAPLIIVNDPENTSSMLVRTEAGATEAAIGSIRNTFDDILPGYELEYEFLDDQYAAMYAAELTTGRLARIFAILAVLISCMGLLGLAAFTAAQRTREIGIRKVLGAGVADIVMLLNRDFGKLLIIAFIAAIPVAFWLLRQWLERYAYHVDLSAGVFIAAGGLILLVAALTVSYHSLRAATANPADSLKYE